MSNLISATFTEQDEQRAMTLLAELKSLFPFGIKLSDDQRKHLPKLDDARLPFVEKGLSYGLQEPLIVPPFIDLNEHKKDIEFFKATRRVGAEILSLAEMVTDSRTAAGSDAFQAALSIYSSTKGAAKQGVPGTQSKVDEMGKLFDGQRNNSKTSNPTAK
jgi:hypothetical protein